MRRCFALGIVVYFLATGSATACDTPVYRYALSHWIPDPHRVLIVHHRPLTSEEQAQVERLQAGPLPPRTTNLLVRTMDVKGAQKDELSPDWIRESVQKPLVVLQLPTSRPGEAAWSGLLTRTTIDHLLDSPARQTLTTHLCRGESVWILLTSGMKTKDDNAEKLLRAELAKRGPEAKPICTVLRLDRTNQAEAVLIRMLLASEPDLTDITEPLVFPVFGRGRVLYALIGAGINPGTIAKAATFLEGACSCTVKKDNPGVDLLLTADWSTVELAESKEPMPTPTITIAAPLVVEQSSLPSRDWKRPLLMIGVGIASVLVVITGVHALRNGRRGETAGR